MRTFPLLLLALIPVGCGGGKQVEIPAPKISGPDPSSLPMKYKDHNVILVSFDALQARHVGVLGYPKNVTPYLDKFAEHSFIFTNATSVSSWTVPSTMSWFTGVYPSEHQMTNKFAVFQPPIQKISNLKQQSPHLVTLAEVLKQNGYLTAGFTGNAGVSGNFGFEQGFDTYYYKKGTFGSLNQSVPRAIQWLKENKDRKFFVFLHGYDVHGQSTPIGGYDYRFVEKSYDQRYLGTAAEQEALREEGLEKGRLSLRDEDVKFWRAIYDEKINRVDERFKTFLDEYQKLGLTEKTLFVLTSDHGTELYEHRRFDHGFTLYQELIHVPLIIKLPGQPGGKFVRDRISSLDVMPTILDLVDAKVPEPVKNQLRGTTLVPSLRGEPSSRDVFSETDYREYTYKRAIISADGWKLICTLEDQSRELFHLTDDPNELTNLAGSHPNRADDLSKKLFGHFQSIGHDLTRRRWLRGLNPVYNSQSKESSK